MDNETNNNTMKSIRKTFKEGQEINTIKYTDNKDIIKVRKISKLGYNNVKFEGLRGWWTFYTNKHRGAFYQGDNHLIIIK